MAGTRVNTVSVCLLSLRTTLLVVSSADDLSSQDQFEVPDAGGWDATLSGEDEDDFFDLQIVKHYDGEVRTDIRGVPFCGTLCIMWPLSVPGLPGQGRGIVGLHRPRVSPAQSWGSLA